jgi:uncharacterized protein with von Willebrand factor type A (vWA) domain
VPSEGFAGRVIELGEELRAEGMQVGTSALLDAFEALEHVGWTDPDVFREALAATLAIARRPTEPRPVSPPGGSRS